MCNKSVTLMQLEVESLCDQFGNLRGSECFKLPVLLVVVGRLLVGRKCQNQVTAVTCLWMTLPTLLR